MSESLKELRIVEEQHIINETSEEIISIYKDECFSGKCINYTMQEAINIIFDGN